MNVTLEVNIPAEHADEPVGNGVRDSLTTRGKVKACLDLALSMNQFSPLDLLDLLGLKAAIRISRDQEAMIEVQIESDAKKLG